MKKLSCKKCPSQQASSSYGMSEQNFKIYLRIKPIQSEEAVNQILKIHSVNKVEVFSPYFTGNETDRIYSFEEVFDGQANNRCVFNRTMLMAIENVLHGFNSTVFIYGMTGAGKTYTMFGSDGTSLKPKQPSEQGLVSMTIDYIFTEMNKQPHIKSQIIISFYEIYNENIRDLLQEEQSPLAIMEDPIHGVFINGLTEITGQDKTHIKDMIASGIQKRSMNSTKSNEVSSRSHAILQFTVKRYKPSTTNANDVEVTESKFFMIDIAGNQKTYHNEERRFIEGVNINKSLLTLGKCLCILAQRKGAYVPFRDSKLTRILKQSLGGNSKTVMIACVSTDKRFYEQTLNTLKYSSIAKRIRNRGVKHNIKIIGRDAVPDHTNCLKPNNPHRPFQAKLRLFFSELTNAIEIKTKIEKLMEDLEESLKQNEELLKMNEGDSKMCHRNINKINDTLKRLSRAHEKQLEKMNRLYEDLLTKIDETAKTKQPQMYTITAESEISQLKQIISEQNAKLQQYSQMLFTTYSKPPSPLPTAHSAVPPQLQPLQFSPEFLKENAQPTQCPPVADPHKQHHIHKKYPISVHSLQHMPNGLHSSSVSTGENQARTNKLQKEIVINLNAGTAESKGARSNRQTFLRRLKETEKKAKAAHSEEITSLIEEHETHRYELGSTELSMLRKLKFFQRQKSREKSCSTTKLLTKSQSSKPIFRRF